MLYKNWSPLQKKRFLQRALLWLLLVFLVLIVIYLFKADIQAGYKALAKKISLRADSADETKQYIEPSEEQKYKNVINSLKKENKKIKRTKIHFDSTVYIKRLLEKDSIINVLKDSLASINIAPSTTQEKVVAKKTHHKHHYGYNSVPYYHPHHYQSGGPIPEVFLHPRYRKHAPRCQCPN